LTTTTTRPSSPTVAPAGGSQCFGGGRLTWTSEIALQCRRAAAAAGPRESSCLSASDYDRDAAEMSPSVGSDRACPRTTATCVAWSGLVWSGRDIGLPNYREVSVMAATSISCTQSNHEVECGSGGATVSGNIPRGGTLQGWEARVS